MRCSISWNTDFQYERWGNGRFQQFGPIRSIGHNRGVPKVTFLPENKTVEFESGKLPYEHHGKPESVLDVALNNGIDLEHACGGSCACTTCHVIVKEGLENLSEADDDELDRLDMAAGLTLRSRLGCQAIVEGDITVEIPEWNRNYISEGGKSKL